MPKTKPQAWITGPPSRPSAYGFDDIGLMIKPSCRGTLYSKIASGFALVPPVLKDADTLFDDTVSVVMPMKSLFEKNSHLG